MPHSCHHVVPSRAIVQMAAVQLTTLASRRNLITWSNSNDFFHYTPFSQALIVAPQLISSGWTAHLGICCNNLGPVSHYLPFSHELMAALQLSACGVKSS